MDILIQKNVALSQFCTYRTGGPARFLAEAVDIPTMFTLREFAKQQGVPHLILGGGSNVLFADEGFPGLVILNRMNRVFFHGQGLVTAEGGVNLMRLILTAAEQNLGGISGLANVPGSVGGAVYGNAGIPDIWIGNVMMHATILPSDQNKPMIVPPDYFEFGYRESKIKRTRDIVLSATLKLTPCPKALIQREVHDYVKARALKQPAGASCGSFFKNPGTFPSAGWLIEQSGCKGMQVGGAQVSEKHGNFFMNTGGAASADILNLALKVHAIVKEKFNVSLEPEVQIIPNNPFNGHSEH